MLRTRETLVIKRQESYILRSNNKIEKTMWGKRKVFISKYTHKIIFRQTPLSFGDETFFFRGSELLQNKYIVERISIHIEIISESL